MPDVKIVRFDGERVDVRIGNIRIVGIVVSDDHDATSAWTDFAERSADIAVTSPGEAPVRPPSVASVDPGPSEAPALPPGSPAVPSEAPGPAPKPSRADEAPTGAGRAVSEAVAEVRRKGPFATETDTLLWSQTDDAIRVVNQDQDGNEVTALEAVLMKCTTARYIKFRSIAKDRLSREAVKRLNARHLEKDGTSSVLGDLVPDPLEASKVNVVDPNRFKLQYGAGDNIDEAMAVGLAVSGLPKS